jgi:hypothetical protein
MSARSSDPPHKIGKGRIRLPGTAKSRTDLPSLKNSPEISWVFLLVLTEHFAVFFDVLLVFFLVKTESARFPDVVQTAAVGALNQNRDGYGSFFHVPTRNQSVVMSFLISRQCRRQA